MPVLFIGHGNPMNAILNNEFTRSWGELGKILPKPQAILTISAHWLTPGRTMVTAMEKPKTIHDFMGFPQELFQQQYPAPGSPQLAQETIKLVRRVHLESDHQWGLDHGTWSVLLPMFPNADIPVYQLSLDYSKDLQFHFDLGKELEKLREKGVLIIGSGNIVHNLRALSFDSPPFDWAEEFDAKIKGFIDDRNFKSVIQYHQLGRVAQLAQPTHDHFLPLLYSLALKSNKENLSYFNESFDLGSISMRSFVIA